VADDGTQKSRNPSLTVFPVSGSFDAGTKVTVESPRLTQPVEANVMPAGAVLEDREVVELLKGALAQGGSWTVRISTPDASERSFEVTADGFNVAAAMFDACVAAESEGAD